VQCIAVAVNIRGQLAIGDTPTHSDGVRLAMENDLVQMGQRNLILGAISDSIKGMAPLVCCSSSPPPALPRPSEAGAGGRY
jgi:hypothetical protein